MEEIISMMNKLWMFFHERFGHWWACDTSDRRMRWCARVVHISKVANASSTRWLYQGNSWNHSGNLSRQKIHYKLDFQLDKSSTVNAQGMNHIKVIWLEKMTLSCRVKIVMSTGKNFLTRVRSSQFFVARVGSGRVSHLWFGFEFEKFALKMSNFSIFCPSGQKKSLRVGSESTQVGGG